MMIRELKKAIQTALSEGKIPLMVGATAGSKNLNYILIKTEQAY